MNNLSWHEEQARAHYARQRFWWRFREWIWPIVVLAILIVANYLPLGGS